MTYANFIIVAGYAGIFALWKSMKPDLDKIVMLSSGLSVLISVLISIFSELHKMVATGTYYRKYFAKLEGELPPTFVDDFRKNTQSFDRRMTRSWKAYFFPTVFFGIAGVGLLLYAFADSLIREILIYFE